MKAVDSCGWLEFIANSENAAFFEEVLRDEKQVLIPSLVIFEVVKRLNQLKQGTAADAFLAIAERCLVVHLNAAQMAQAARASIEHKLALADAIIWQSAQSHQAKLYTQDVDLKGLPGVVYQEKRKPT